MPPYTDWATAARTLQAAVDAAEAGDEIVVTNGVYATGGRAVVGTLTNRVAVDRRIAVRSVNGPQFTIIQGRQAPGATNGEGAIRCAYLVSGASLSGFTLTGGATSVLAADDNDRRGGALWCETTNVMVSNCVLANNTASYRGGGAYRGFLSDCILTNNQVAFEDGSGGGADSALLFRCTLGGNYAWVGGGARFSALQDCVLAGNRAVAGGGAAQCSVTNCVLAGNTTAHAGGGSVGGWAQNCLLTGNSAGGEGGGNYGGILVNCTVVGNWSRHYGGGASGSWLTNCIVYYNRAGRDADNYYFGKLAYCCTTPLPPEGVGNLDLDPQLASLSHLSADSPCRRAGGAWLATGRDFDDEPFSSTPSIGCDEYWPATVTGPLTVGLSATYTNISVNHLTAFTAQISGRTTASVWDFGDGMLVTNQPCATHAWNNPGDYTASLRAYNSSHPQGVSASMTVRVCAPTVHYVALESPDPRPPYDSWATAARGIQEAIDVAVPGAMVLVTNGVYQEGGRLAVGTLTNRIVVGKPIVVRSVNGPEVTTIRGYQVPGSMAGTNAIRCVYLGERAGLIGFTLTGGATSPLGDVELDLPGAGVWCESWSSRVEHCVLVGNWASSDGGGAYQGSLNRCTLIGNVGRWGAGGALFSRLNYCLVATNSAPVGGGAGFAQLYGCRLVGNVATQEGGGTDNCNLENCLLTGNTARYSGGAVRASALNFCTVVGNAAGLFGGGAATLSTLTNSILYFNTASDRENYDNSTLNYCCTTPLPEGVGNLSLDPRLMDRPGGNLRLAADSPCINAGRSSPALGPTDLDGRFRVLGLAPDLGAYEFQSTEMGQFLGWLERYGLPTDYRGLGDSDGDGATNWQEWQAGTDPTNSGSVLRLRLPAVAGPRVVLSWDSVVGHSYWLECRTNLDPASGFQTLATNLTGQAGVISFVHTNSAAMGSGFYRLEVR